MNNSDLCETSTPPETGVFAQRALVREINGDLVTLELDGDETCFGCMNRNCRKKMCLIQAENRGGLSLSLGQSVTAVFPRRLVLVQALAAILPPVLGFLAGYLIPAALSAGDGQRIGGGLAGLLAAAAFSVVRRVFRRRPRKEGRLLLR
ncbi:MAG: SoxR reducing system RseC family protein [Treponema sp.]|jgi:sigma-E factor negative regulatory protein RseC|nr:SoxR reducing system RseC family protein [Treponema sp.]